PLHLPCRAIIIAQRDISAVFMQMLLVRRVIVGNEEQPTALQPNDARPLAAHQLVDDSLALHPGLTAILARRQRHLATNLRILAAKPQYCLAILCYDDG